MESWSFPPVYDEGYLPEPASRYWFRARETMPASEREALILERLKVVCAYVYERAPFYRRKWDAAGFHPSQLNSLEDFESKVPVVEKKDLRAAQELAPPFGDYLCVPEAEVFHIHGTSGTTGRPTAFAIGRRDWRAIANAHARIMWAMGLRPGDTICVAAIFSLYMGSWGALAGAERLGARCFPFGAGVAGMSVRCVHWLNMIKPTAFYGTPTYALHLAEVAAAEGLNPRDFRLKIMFFSGEPGASIPGVRGRIEELYGAKVMDCGSMAEMTPWMNVAGTAETSGLLCWQDVVYTEVCAPDTMRRVAYGERGTPVYTHLERNSQPMIRLLSGDLTQWTNDPNPCGRTYPRLPHGIFGRIDDMFTIRGENVYPSEIDAALNELKHYGGEHRILISRGTAMDELLLRVEADAATAGAGAPAISAFRAEVERKVQKLLGLRALVEVVEPNSIARTDFKARRVIDDRKIFADMHAQIEKAQS
jgi:phenylacetate-CoA ligase